MDSVGSCACVCAFCVLKESYHILGNKLNMQRLRNTFHASCWRRCGGSIQLWSSRLPVRGKYKLSHLLRCKICGFHTA